MDLTHKDIEKAIVKSQHCQRNWDLTKELPEADMNLLVHAVTNCPSKQNIAFYKAHFITDRSVIEEIHSTTSGFKNYNTGEYETNSQTLANLVIAFELEDYIGRHKEDSVFRNDEMYSLDTESKLSETERKNLVRDSLMAIGIAAGYANLTATMLGYGTGCCACFDSHKVAEIIGAKTAIKLLMGIGYKDATRPRREHHSKPEFVFPTKKKQPINVKFIK